MIFWLDCRIANWLRPDSVDLDDLRRGGLRGTHGGFVLTAGDGVDVDGDSAGDDDGLRVFVTQVAGAVESGDDESKDYDDADRAAFGAVVESGEPGRAERR